MRAELDVAALVHGYVAGKLQEDLLARGRRLEAGGHHLEPAQHEVAVNVDEGHVDVRHLREPRREGEAQDAVLGIRVLQDAIAQIEEDLRQQTAAVDDPYFGPAWSWIT